MKKTEILKEKLAAVKNASVFRKVKDQQKTDAALPGKEKKRHTLKAGLIRRALFAVAVLLIILAVVNAASRTRYGEYAVEEDTVVKKTDNVSVYEAVDNYILRYSRDGAALLNKKLGEKWNVTYNMEDPKSDICGTTLVIYDHNGTDVQVFDKNGSIGSFKTTSQIVKARVSKQGNVAVLLSEGNSSVIRYYSAGGSEIAAISSTLKTNGYPLDFDVSPNGLYLAVSFTEIEGGQAGTRLCFYDFSSAGRSYEENLAASDACEGVLVPEIYYADDTTIAAVRSDGFAIYSGRIPALRKKVGFDQEIISFFHDDSHLGFVFAGENSDSPYLVKLYGLSGNMISSGNIGISYDRVTVSSGQIIMSSEEQLGIYSMNGNCCYEGLLDEGSIAGCLRIGQKRYLLVTNSKTEVIYLK